ncbi:hypothetical protein E2562_037882 [Oryza meyeriana var. granulata]|uniref:ABC-transporter extension domain-containing protein n=1 Tax=Oryza meyeriana var. granulata TaxID=110450 RepID=A0A6G1DSU9_9ORYZ|nr:hypothetical protein E2562_037882 [Oryza meyeriana var. granulata]
MVEVKIQKLMPELGFAPEDADRLVASFGGGWQMRMFLEDTFLAIWLETQYAAWEEQQKEIKQTKELINRLGAGVKSGHASSEQKYYLERNLEPERGNLLPRVALMSTPSRLLSY